MPKFRVLKLDYEVTEDSINWKLTIFGIFFLCFRIICMSSLFLSDGNIRPEAFHASYFISILLSLSMVFSFRVKPLNVVSVQTLPTVIFSIIMHDIPIWINPTSGGLGQAVVGDLIWWNFITIHTPIPILAFYMYITRKHTLDANSYWITYPFLLTWFLTLDNMENGTLNGPAYLALLIPTSIVWGLLYSFLIMRGIKSDDSIIAPVLKWKKLFLSDSKGVKVRNNEQK